MEKLLRLKLKKLKFFKFLKKLIMKIFYFTINIIYI